MSESSARASSAGTDQPFLGRDYGAEADYSKRSAREIDDEIRRVIEGPERSPSCGSTWTAAQDLNILIEYETIDRDQFVRLLVGEDEAGVFPEEALSATGAAGGAAGARRERPRPRPFPLPGSAMQGRIRRTASSTRV
jgi:hypothetical protein